MSYSDEKPPIPEELWMLCAYDGDGTNGRWVGSHIVGLCVVATDERTAEEAAMEHRKKYDQGCICIPVLVKSAEKPREEQRRPVPALKPYILPSGDMINLLSVESVRFHPEKTGYLPFKASIVVGSRSESGFMCSVPKISYYQIMFESDNEAEKARDRVIDAVMAAQAELGFANLFTKGG